ncbi:hypothetical protein ABZY57_04950 [Streptomyces sp. NPDC006450]|uniref:hypothetical protein n=1 Tax=Streptomyces sp. NPDC006450 TaxID=3155458 RepID=UPI0033AF1BB9
MESVLVLLQAILVAGICFIFAPLLIGGLGPHAYEEGDPGTGERVGYAVVAAVAGLIFLIASVWYLLGLMRSFLTDVLPGRRAQVACVLQASLLVSAIVVEMWPLVIITAPLLLLMVSVRMADRGRRPVTA